MKKSSFVFVTLLFALQLLCLRAFGQKHDYIWVFGYDNLPNDPLTSQFGGAYIDFNETPAKCFSINRKLNFSLNAGACCDSTGKLQFYTNGIAIHNYMNELIENGDSINYDSVFWVASKNRGYTHYIGPFAIPYPNHLNQYFLLHTSWRYEPDSLYVRVSTLYYSHIDMEANGGSGKVISKNNIIIEGDLGWPAACKHGNGRDWWIITYRLSRPMMISYLVTPEGVLGPYEQPIGLGSGFPQHESKDKSCFSPNGKFYIRHDGQNGIRIFDFDRCTGLFSNQKILQYPEDVYTWSATFSDDSHFLYLQNQNVIYTIDMYNINNIQVMDTVGVFNRSYCDYPFSTRIFEMQEAPDGKIYGCGNPASSLCMSRVEKPKLPAPANEVAYGGFELTRWNSSTICHFPHYRLGEYEGSPCDTLNFQQPGDGFYKSVYGGLQSESQRIDPQEDYIIIPVGNPTSDPVAIEEKKRRHAEMNRVEYELFIKGDERENRWPGGLPTSGVAEAFFDGNPSQTLRFASQFLINSSNQNSPLWADPRIPATDWFDYSGNSPILPENQCVEEWDPNEDTRSVANTMAIGGTFEAYKGYPASTWEAELDAFGVLAEDANTRPAGSPEEVFYNTHLSANLGKLYRAKHAWENIALFTTAFEGDWNINQTAIATKLEEIRAQTQLMQEAETEAQQLQIAQTLATLHAALTALQLTNQSLSAQYKTDIAGKANQLASDLDNITTTDVWEQNLKTVLDLSVEKLLSESADWTTTQYNALKAIADQCRHEGGIGVVMARAAVGSYQYDDEAMCPGQGQPRSSNAARLKASIAPNPALEQCRITFDQPVSGQMVVYNFQGQVVRSIQLSEVAAFDLDVRTLPAGLYNLHVSTQQGTLLDEKIVVIH